MTMISSMEQLGQYADSFLPRSSGIMALMCEHQSLKVLYDHGQQSFRYFTGHFYRMMVEDLCVCVFVHIHTL